MRIAVILFTGQVSHNARHEVVRAARRHKIALYQCHSYGCAAYEVTTFLQNRFSSTATVTACPAERRA